MEKVIIGKEIEFNKTFTIENVLDFSQISEDNNPIHIDEKYANESLFGKRVVHGVLLISMFSKIFGTIYPGNGTIYLSQTSKFIKPAYIGDTIKAKITLFSFDNNNKQGIFITECFKELDTLIFKGEAKILFPNNFEL